MYGVCSCAAEIEPCIFERLLRGENSDTAQRLVQASRRNQTGNPGDRCRIFRFAPMHRGVFAAATSVHSSRRQRTGTRGGARALPFFGSVRSEDSEIVKIDEISFCEIRRKACLHEQKLSLPAHHHRRDGLLPRPCAHAHSVEISDSHAHVRTVAGHHDGHARTSLRAPSPSTTPTCALAR